MLHYLALARKWRPQHFADFVGQEHVVRSLVHALDSGRLHHAFLFTGIRGVGKTTVARLMAKALNCDQGVSSAPCGACAACLEIEQGRFVDLIEVDAATFTQARTGILQLARRYNLSAYDASYLELSLRRGLPLATLDEDLQRAAKKAGVKRLR